MQDLQGFNLFDLSSYFNGRISLICKGINTIDIEFNFFIILKDSLRKNW